MLSPIALSPFMRSFVRPFEKELRRRLFFQKRSIFLIFGCLMVPRVRVSASAESLMPDLRKQPHYRWIGRTVADIPALQKTGDERSTMVISLNKITGGLLRMCTKTPPARFHAELWQCELYHSSSRARYPLDYQRTVNVSWLCTEKIPCASPDRYHTIPLVLISIIQSICCRSNKSTPSRISRSISA